MADLKISALNSLAGADLVAADVVAVVDDSASETKKLTVSDLIANGVTLISNSTIPSAKILFAAGSVATASVADAGITTAKVADDAITAAKLANNSSVTLVSTLPGSGDFTGQVALDTDDSKIYVWSGSAWTSVKGAGSINVVNGSTTGEINIVASTSGDTVTISATLDNTTAAAQFLGGPTGAAGAVGYRALVGTDLPTPTTSTKGGVIVNGEGLRMDSDTIEIDNDLTANTSSFQAVKFDSKGLITSGRDITAADLPNATSGAVGAVKPGSGLSMGSAGAINHTNAVTGATNTKITFDAQGHVTAGANLAASDVPDLDTAKITTGTFPTARIADDAVTAAKLGDRSTATIAETTPAGGAFIGQTHLNSITGDYFLWDGNVWQPIGISVGEIVLAGTYDANTNLMATVTSEGTAIGFTVGSALPTANSANKGYYVVVSESGTGTSPAPTVSLSPPDFLLSTGTVYTEIDVSSTVVAQVAENVAFTAAGNISATNVQAAIEELDTEKVGSASPTFTGTVALGEDAVMTFEGATSNDFETTLTVADPTADRTITLPNVTGTVVTTGDTGSVTSAMIADGAIVNADINASAEIAVSKLANGSARQLLQTASNGTDVEFTSNVDVPGTLDCTGAGTFDSTLTVTGVINADGKVKFPAGTAAAPSFYSGTDTNTGLYFSAADEVSVATGGTQRVVFDGSGRLLVGTSSSLTQYGAQPNLQVAGTGFDSSTLSVRRDSDNANPPGIILAKSRGSLGGNTVVQNNDKIGELNFAAADGTDVTTLAAQVKAEVDGTPGSNDMPGRLVFSTTADGASSPSERLRIDSSGNVGIGSTAPLTPLDVVVSGDNVVSRFSNGTRGLEIAATSTGGSLQTYNATQTIDIKTFGATDSDIKFSTNNTERMRIDSSGNVGVGTTSPNAATGDKALHIHSSASSGTRGACLHLTTNSSGTATSDGAEINLIDNDLKVFNKESGIIYFGTGNSERMRIDSSGNVGIGATSPGRQLTLSHASQAEIGLLSGADTSGALIYQNASEQKLLIANRESDGHIAFQAGGANERMRIASDGVVTVKNGAVAEIDTLTSASTVTPDFAASCNFTLTLGTNVTLANPSNLTAGQSGSIFLVQDGTGSRTLTLGSSYDFAGGTAPTLSTAANAVDRLDYIVRTSTSIHCVVTLAYS